MDWISKTLPETLNWRSLTFNSNHNVFILTDAAKKYFYTTTNFDVFIKINLPFDLSSGTIFIGIIREFTFITIITSSLATAVTYISKDLKTWIKTNISGLYLKMTVSPPNYILGNALGVNVKTYEFRNDLFYSPPYQTNTTNVNAFVRTALD